MTSVGLVNTDQHASPVPCFALVTTGDTRVAHELRDEGKDNGPAKKIFNTSECPTRAENLRGQRLRGLNEHRDSQLEFREWGGL